MGFGDLVYAAKRTKGKILERLLKERMMLGMAGMAFPRNHYLFEEFNKRFQQLFRGGFIKLFIEQYEECLDPKRFRHLHPGDEPQVLTMEHLKAGFVVWVISFSFAIIAFIAEWIIRLKQYFAFKFIICAYFEQESLKRFHDITFQEAAALVLNQKSQEEIESKREL
jgi:hypothetical protein